MGLVETYTLLYPEAIILDSDIYHRARYALMNMDTSQEALALDTIRAVGPGGHFLAQKHTRTHMRDMLARSVTQQIASDNKYLDPLEVAHERVKWILENHHPEPLEATKKAELARILAAADRELN